MIEDDDLEYTIKNYKTKMKCFFDHAQTTCEHWVIDSEKINYLKHETETML